MHSTEHDQAQSSDVRPLARTAARELSDAEIAVISGGIPKHTHATGINGDDPGDPPVYV